MQSRTLLHAFVVVCAAYAVVASSSDVRLSDELLDNIVPETDMLELEPKHGLVPAQDLVQEALQTALSRVSPVTEAIVALKSYCMGATDLLDSLDKSVLGDSASSLVKLIQNFGGETKKGGDVVDEFADVILGLRSGSTGLTDYIVKNVNMAVLKGKSPVQTYPLPNGNAGYVVTFNAEIVGLVELPAVYTEELGVPLVTWGQLKTKIEAEVSQTWDPVKVPSHHAQPTVGHIYSSP